MNTLVISDTHLGKYDEKKDRFLQNLIKGYDRIIVNGDFWDNWAISFEDFINSKYRELFNLLKQKETIYIFGNHDSKDMVDLDLARTFSDIQSEEYNIKIGNNFYHFEHGHNFVDDMNNWFYDFYYRLLEGFPAFLLKFLYDLTQISYSFFPIIISKGKLGHNRNFFIKNNKPKNVYYVVGDTHVPEIDKKARFVNTGCILGRTVSYVEIDNETGEPRLIRYKLTE
jgi:predicted phosphodiesterase